MQTVTCITNKDGSKFYFNNNGELHRTDGHAANFSDGVKEYWINGEKVTKAEFLIHALSATVQKYYSLMVARVKNN